MKHKSLIAATCGIILAFPFAGKADTSFTINTTTADAFLSGASPTLNFGSAGTLAIAPASSAKGEFDSVIMFNTASAVSQFNTTYGAGNWTITGLTLSLASNFGTQGAQPNNAIFNTINAGSFGIDWLANDSWVEGTGGGNGAANGAVSFNSIPSLLSPGYDSLGTYTYTPPGNNVYANYSLSLDANLVSDAAAGGAVSLYFYAADNQVSYLFNSREFASNHPELTVTAAPVPEPNAAALLAASLGGFLFSRRQKRKR
ncbi:MAG: PEP-CTERM sorting domain-containing protein [Limisphaerales bacterium]